MCCCSGEKKTQLFRVSIVLPMWVLDIDGLSNLETIAPDCADWFYFVCTYITYIIKHCIIYGTGVMVNVIMYMRMYVVGLVEIWGVH